MDHDELKSRIAWMIRDLGLLYANLLDEECHNTTEGGEMMGKTSKAAPKKKAASKPTGKIGKSVKKK